MTVKPLRLERTLNATPEQVWAAWTDPKQYAKWLNPSPGLDLVIHEWDLRVGGRVRFDMPLPDGKVNHEEGTFHVLKPHTELVSGSPDKSFLIRATFEATGPRTTRLVVEITGVPPEWHSAATQGWGSCFEKLQKLLSEGDERAPVADAAPSAKGFTLERTFKAAPEKVWEMWTTPKGIMAWWAPSAREMGFEFTVKEMDVREGGTFAFAMVNKQHNLLNHGTYRVVKPHSDLAWTWRFDIYLAPGEKPYDVPIDIRFERVGTGTRMTFRQGPLATPGFTEGSRQGVMQNLDYLAKALGE